MIDPGRNGEVVQDGDMTLTFIGEDDRLPVGVSHRMSNSFARGVR